MFGWFKRKSSDSSVQLLDLRSEVQKLKIEIQERDKTLARLKDDLSREREARTTQVAESIRDSMEKLMVNAASPVSQLVTQAHLLESQDKPVQARDVISVSKRLIRVFEDAGMKTEGSIGEIASFDPNYHAPLAGDASIKIGDRVIIRLTGVSFNGRIIRKAGVETCQDA